MNLSWVRRLEGFKQLSERAPHASDGTTRRGACPLSSRGGRLPQGLVSTDVVNLADLRPRLVPGMQRELVLRDPPVGLRDVRYQVLACT